MTKTPKAPKADAKTSIPVKTPCERAQESQTKAEQAATRTKALFDAANADDLPQGAVVLSDDAIRELGDLATEAQALFEGTQLSAGIACQGDVPHARRLSASSRAKRAAEDAAEIATEAQALVDRAAAEADDEAIEEAENTPGYTTNPVWIAAQERRAARIHRS